MINNISNKNADSIIYRKIYYFFTKSNCLTSLLRFHTFHLFHASSKTTSIIINLKLLSIKSTDYSVIKSTW
jgi:hypothetical protein